MFGTLKLLHEEEVGGPFSQNQTLHCISSIHMASKAKAQDTGHA